MKLKIIIKRKILNLGFAPWPILDTFNGLLKYGRFLKKNRDIKFFEERLLLYSYLNEHILKNSAIDYLEFGVCQGQSIKAWAEINTNISSRFFGFDSFEGLPEEEDSFFITALPGTYSVGGKKPQIGDNRIELIQGYFQESLPIFLENYHNQNQVVVHLDADFYSSSLYALTKLDCSLIPGTILIFDNFSSPNDDFRAFMDYICSYRKNYSVIGIGGETYQVVALRIV